MQPVIEISKQTHVRAIFADSVTFFDLPLHITMEDFSERIARLSEHHVGGPVSIDVRRSDKAAWVPWRVHPGETFRSGSR
jgi:hypothetical protein